MNKRIFFFQGLLSAAAYVYGTVTVFAADTGTGYLTYREPQANQSVFSLSTAAYVLSLLITFLIILGLAYFTSKMLGSRLGHMSLATNHKVLTTIPLGTNRAIYIVQIAGRYLVLGVTEQNIRLLYEISSPDEIEEIKAQALGFDVQEEGQLANVFERHLASLQHITKKFLEKR